MMSPRRQPTYPLSRVQSLVRAGLVRVTELALDEAGALGFGYDDVLTGALALRPEHFRKPMAVTAPDAPALFQDCYLMPEWRGVAVYVKLQIDAEGWAWVVQFKQPNEGED